MRLLVVIVAFNNASTLPSTLRAVASQLGPKDTLYVHDNSPDGTSETTKSTVSTAARFEVFSSAENLGFTGGNNSALARGEWERHDALLLLNPDVILPDGWITRALVVLDASPKTGIVSGPLVKYDFQENRSTEILDSLGIYRAGLVRSWKDRGQGQATSALARMPQQWSPPAICGALMLLPRAAVRAVIDSGQLFDDRFFAYKEDIDLSLRMRKAGFDLLLSQQLLAYHGRGWNKRRGAVSYELRKLSARNDLYLHYKHRSAYLPFSLLKAGYVYLVERFIRPN